MAALLAALILAAPPQAAERPPPAAERERSVAVAGVTRTYTLITPQKVRELLPLVIVFHGGGQTADQARRYARFDDLPRKENVAVVYPQGLGNNWNDGRRSGDLDQRLAATTDDVEFTRQIIGQLETEGLINPSRVFLTGASNGGMMAMRVACELNTRIAGIAPVVANLPTDWQCEASRMPALFIHGTDDAYMPFAGGQVAAGKSRRDLGRVTSVDETITTFRRINGCDAVKETKTIDEVARDKTKAIVTEYECKNAPLKQIVIEGGGHTWPGARERLLAEFILGETSQELEATNEIWGFFKSIP